MKHNRLHCSRLHKGNSERRTVAHGKVETLHRVNFQRADVCNECSGRRPCDDFRTRLSSACRAAHSVMWAVNQPLEARSPGLSATRVTNADCTCRRHREGKR